MQGSKNEINLQYHLDMLKFCDNLSLYICLNEPGIEKVNEHPFFQNGFPQIFPFAENQPIISQWLSKDTISLSVSPLKHELKIDLPFKDVKKTEIKEHGLISAFHATIPEVITVTFI